MRKQFVKVMLFCALALTASATFVGCKDYDDDIDALWEAVDGKVTPEQLQNQVTTLQTSINDAKSELATVKSNATAALTAAQEAKTKAEAALTAANTAGDKAEADAAQAKIDAAEALKKAQQAILDAADAKAKAIEAAEAKLGALKTELEKTIADKASKADVAAFQTKLDDLATKANNLSGELSKLLGHRLTSVVRISNYTVNDEPAILFDNIAYIPQIANDYTAYTQGGVDGIGDGEVTKDKTPDGFIFIDNGLTEVKYQLSPKVGVRKSDIGKPYFMSDTQTNITRAVKQDLTGKETPIEVNSYALDPNTGILTVKAKKTNAIAKRGDAYGNIDFQKNESGTRQTYYIASLRVPIDQELWTEDDKVEAAKGNIPEVASEYSRLVESTVVPMIKQKGTKAQEEHKPKAYDRAVDRKDLLNKKNDEGKYVHYHDAKSLLGSAEKELIDFEIDWDKPFDLKTVVDVCRFEELVQTAAAFESDGSIKSYKYTYERGDHGSLDYASYGLKFKFYINEDKYLQGANNTDQQKFAEIPDPDAGILQSRTYTVNGVAQTAIGREPIVRIDLVDSNNDNNLVARRYLKLRFIKSITPIDLPEYEFTEKELISCKYVNRTFLTQEMNEKIYRELNKATGGWSKDNFHRIYTEISIESLKKDATEILTTRPSWLNRDLTYTHPENVSLADADLAAETKDVTFAMIKDQDNSNMSYNLKWYMSPAAIGPLNGGSAIFTIKVKFEDPAKVNPAIYMEFIQTIGTPEQSFKYQGTSWQTGAIGNNGIFNVNPIVYDTPTDGNLANKANANHATHTLVDYSHIEADLVEGFLYTNALKPANLAQFIKYIRICADVRFEFDKEKFSQYDYLSGYTTNAAQDELWKTAAGTINPKDQYLQPNNSAATIENKFGATSAENKKNFPWDLDEQLGSGFDEASAIIRLSETDALNGTDPAKALVGKKVPVRLVVEYNEYNKIPVQKFDVFFINPLNIDAKIGDKVQDAVINGSYVDVEKGLTFTDWNKYTVAKVDIANPTEKQKYAHELWHYYGVKDVIFDVSNVKTDLAWNGDKYVPTENVKNGNLPTNRSLKQVEKQAGNSYIEVTKNPTHLGYFNNNGTPVNLNYKMFINVKVTHKWGETIKPDLVLDVLRADGTPE